jgi:hypothetical protein
MTTKTIDLGKMNYHILALDVQNPSLTVSSNPSPQISRRIEIITFCPIDPRRTTSFSGYATIF